MPMQTANRSLYRNSAMAKALLKQTEPSRKKGGLGIDKIKETSTVTKSVHFGGKCHKSPLPKA